MKILKDEQILLEERKEECFYRFLDRVSDIHLNSNVWQLIQHKLFEIDSIWHEIEYTDEKFEEEAKKEIEKIEAKG